MRETRKTGRQMTSKSPAQVAQENFIKWKKTFYLPLVFNDIKTKINK